MRIAPIYVEIESHKRLLDLEHLLWDNGFCFIEGFYVAESLEECEQRLIREGLAIDPKKETKK